MPCWAELEDQFEMDCSRQGAMTRSAVLTSFLSLAFFTPHAQWLLLFLFHLHFLSSLLLFRSIVSHLSFDRPLRCTLLVTHLSTLILIYAFCTVFHLLPSLLSWQLSVRSKDGDDFISRRTNLHR
uniref:PPUP9003 n=1 Tax=Poeciliopsis prolifica TaxID=188132 RepID=A0A0S7EQP1_9TELE